MTALASICMNEGTEKLPLDAKLLSDAVIELNISRRSVGLYPPEHPIVRKSIDRAYQYLQKLFEIRPAITLGVASDTLVIDEYKLDRTNPVFREFANSLYDKGIAAVTFSSGLSKEELRGVHELMTDKDMPAGKDLVERAKVKNIAHIRLNHLDFSSFRFVEGAQKKDMTGTLIWEDYIYCLLEGKLSTGDGEAGLLLDIPPEEVARVVSASIAGENCRESYDRVITGYLKGKEGSRLSRESYKKFISFIENLSPELKRQFLSRSFVHTATNIEEIEKMIADMTTDDFNRIARIFAEHTSVIPATLKNLIDKLSSINQSSSGQFDFFSQNSAVVDDVGFSEDFVKLFEGDHFKAFVSEDYQRDLNEMLAKSSGSCIINSEALTEECSDEMIDRTLAGVMIELLESDCSRDDYLDLLTKLSWYASAFIETGRFEEVLDIYNTVVSHSLHGGFGQDASDIIEYFFHSKDFEAKFINALRLRGRKDREGVFRLAKAIRKGIIVPLIEALLSEPEPSMRKFFLSVLKEIGSDVNPYAIKKLNDERWFAVRNILYLLRECDGKPYVSHIRRFAKHKNIHICIEAVKALLHFKTPDAIPLLKLYLQSDKEDLRRAAVRLAGAFRVKEAVPYLVRILEKKDIFGTESGSKIDAVRALGEIGDSSTVETLFSLCHARSLFYKGYLEALKVEIFGTLGNYPPDSIRELLAVGLGSDNKEIRSLAEKITAQPNFLEKKNDRKNP